MANLDEVVQQLKKERERAQMEVARIDAALAALGSLRPSGHGQRRTLSAAGRRAISLAQKARWAKANSNGRTAAAKPRRKMSAATRRRIAAAQKARWAVRKAQQKKAA
ncbi:MAG: hypothetical protein WAM69_15835 [Candidatus Sulfotelmatobacter sp.]